MLHILFVQILNLQDLQEFLYLTCHSKLNIVFFSLWDKNFKKSEFVIQDCKYFIDQTIVGIIKIKSNHMESVEN